MKDRILSGYRRVGPLPLCPLKIVYTIADLQPESGGPTRSVAALAEAVGGCFDPEGDAGGSIEVNVLALEYGEHASAPIPPKAPVRTTLVPCRGHLGRKLKRTPLFSRTLLKELRAGSPPDRPHRILHDSGLWLPTNHSAAKAARATRVPFIISPRGMLTSWALRFRGFKKSIAWRLYQQRDLQSAQVLHATAPAEAEDFRALGFRQPIAVIPNGVELPPETEERRAKSAERSGEREAATLHAPRSTLHPPAPPRTALFLSRIHPKKGLLDLVKAWHAVRPPGWRMVIAGTDEIKHQAEVQKAVQECGLSGEFDFIGPVPDARKWEVYRQADLFVLPTHSENFGIVIAEALASAVPVITTKGAPWEGLLKHRCGWWTDIGVEPLAVALRDATALSDEQRWDMGVRGRKLIETSYTWPSAAGKMVAVYRWMLGEGDKPEWVSQS